MLSHTISDAWSFSQVPSETWPDAKDEWHSCKVPTSVHAELERLGKIPNPHKGLAEWDVQWVQEADWAFKTSFNLTKEQLAKACADLVFHGLDTYCTISLNGKRLSTTDNMFIEHRIPAKDVLREGSNDLVLSFASPLITAKALEAANGGPRALWNGESNRLYARKAQYGWGWDWGPVIMTSGPWRPVVLECYDYRIEARVDADLTGEAYDTATLEVSALDIQPAPPSEYKVVCTLKDAAGNVVREGTAQKPQVSWELKSPGEVQPWWPVGYGKQPLYSLEVVLTSKEGEELASTSQRVAFRHARVVEEPLNDQPGSSFLFEVNGVRIFCGGSNWIPADTHLTEIEPERYRRWVDLLVSGNQNMLRIWAGGIYEEEALYNACDEAGILVWQDFMFGCGLYPSYPELNANVKREAEQVVARLRRHPSVVIFAGNNEDYQIAEEQRVVDYDDNSGDYMKTKFPARHIYEIILPEVVGRLSNIHYHRGSPYGGKNSRDPTVGDIHQWNVWHGTQEPYSGWSKLAGRFVSEFGMQGYPDVRTIREWYADEEERKREWYPQSRISAQHNKADGGDRRIALYLEENLRYGHSMEDYAYATQLMQAEALGAAYRLWRREWRGRGREYVAGALVWQINDCWPCVSWAIADFYLRPKPAFFAIARELRTYTVGMTRTEVKKMRDSQTSAFFTLHDRLEVWACNATLEAKRARLELAAFDLSTGRVARQSLEVELAPNASTEVWAGDVPGSEPRTSYGNPGPSVVVSARLLGLEGEEVLARSSAWPEPLKYIALPDPKVVAKVSKSDNEVTLSCSAPAKGVMLDVEGDAPAWSDQAIDLFPGDNQVVAAAGLRGRKVLVKHLGQQSG